MIIEDYIEYQNRYVKQFGNKTIVLMEVGSFFEYYYINNKETISSNDSDTGTDIDSEMMSEWEKRLEGLK